MPSDDVIDRTVEIAQGLGDQHFADVGFDAILRQVGLIYPTLEAAAGRAPRHFWRSTSDDEA
jgi:hypothetical protein